MAIQTESWNQLSNVSLPIQTESYVPRVIFPTYDDEKSFNTTPLPPLHAVAEMLTGHDENDVGDDHASDSDDDDYDDENLDPHWQLPDEEKFNDDEVISSEDEFDRSSTETPDSEKKFVVFDSNLNDFAEEVSEMWCCHYRKKEKNNW